MKVKNYQVVAATEAVNALVQARGINARAGFRIARLARELGPTREDIQKSQQRASEGHAKKGEGGKPLTEQRNGPDGKPLKGADGEALEFYVFNDAEALATEVRELMDAEVELPVQALPIGDLEGAELPDDWPMVKLVLALGPFVDDGADG